MSEQASLALQFPADGVAEIILDAPNSGANLLSVSVLQELETHLDALDARDDVRGLIISSAKPGMFIAGADLKEFVAWVNSSPEKIEAVSRHGQSLLRRLSECSYVTIAAIDGICVGGGSELATWCDRRILTNNGKTALGFPEVKLGLYPGWGGTVRLPRLVGLGNAVEMITTGDNVHAAAALAMGLADHVVSLRPGFEASDQLRSAAMAMIDHDHQSGDYKAFRARTARPIAISDTELAFLGATASALIQQKTRGHYPAPLAALEVMLGAAGLGIDDACSLEATEFVKLFGSSVSRSLLNVFFLSDANKKDPGVANEATSRSRFKLPPGFVGIIDPIEGQAVTPRSIKSVGVVGAGVMGQGIAAAHAKRGIGVILTDREQEALDRGVRGALEEISYDKATKGPSVAKALSNAPLVKGSLRTTALESVDMVIEAIVERRDIKQKFFKKLDKVVAADAIICSNTSTIPISELAESVSNPGRFCGFHFFNPVRQMPLVEVIRGKKTTDATIASAVALAKRLGKSPIVVEDGPGFLVNRLLFPYMIEAAQLVTEGVPIDQVERASKKFGMPMGPITLFDVVGLDTCLHAGRVMHDAFPDRMIEVPIVERLVKAGRLGQKNDHGFFDYDPKRRGKGKPSGEVAELIGSVGTGSEQVPGPDEITDRLFLSMALEATRALEEGIVRTVGDLDLALILGIGFPPFRGGLLFWVDQVGASDVLQRVERLESIGTRFKPTEMLRKHATDGTRFYGDSPLVAAAEQ